MAIEFPITPEGYEKLKAQLKFHKEVERPQNVKDIETALDHGDLSENAEYDAAKNKQGLLHAQIADLSDKVARSKIIDPTKISSESIVFGATVTLEDTETGEEKIYQILGQYEVDLELGRISVNSPVAKALIGKGEGDTAIVKAPGGGREFEIVAVKYK